MSTDKIPTNILAKSPSPPTHSWWQRLKAGWSWKRFALEVVLIVLIVMGIQWFQSRNLVDEGEPAPALSLPVANASSERETTLWSLQSPTTRKRLLYFWAPWCGVCNQMTSTISTLHKDLAQDVEVVSVACAYKSVQEVKDYIREHEVDYPVLLADPSISERFHVESFPTFYVISDEGKILSRFLGFTTSWGLRLRLM